MSVADCEEGIHNMHVMDCLLQLAGLAVRQSPKLMNEICTEKDSICNLVGRLERSVAMQISNSALWKMTARSRDVLQQTEKDGKHSA